MKILEGSMCPVRQKAEKTLRKSLISALQDWKLNQCGKGISRRTWWEMVSVSVEEWGGLPAIAEISRHGEYITHTLFFALFFNKSKTNRSLLTCMPLIYVADTKENSINPNKAQSITLNALIKDKGKILGEEERSQLWEVSRKGTVRG